MSVLTKEEILKAIENKEIEVTPLDEKAIGCASIDLTLSNEFRYYKPSINNTVRIEESTDYKDLTEKVVLKEGETYLLLPGQAALGITVENIKLNSNICGLLEGRSRFARLGLFVHITAGFMNPGINSRQVLEIYNASNNALALVPGTKVCQFVFMRTIGNGSYNGKFLINDL
eukprot:TRINITY_DN1629_c1_g1_i2.p1 TRINITY_DN1629_c1_g1~~TRINITY_DN1629_c1_g1_i2.p1  ORF type:complete len:173 (-),score=45.91 TRINITY_DN1629_c1_g1_i2:79-597(-)